MATPVVVMQVSTALMNSRDKLVSCAVHQQLTQRLQAKPFFSNVPWIHVDGEIPLLDNVTTSELCAIRPRTKGDTNPATALEKMHLILTMTHLLTEGIVANIGRHGLGGKIKLVDAQIEEMIYADYPPQFRLKMYWGPRPL